MPRPSDDPRPELNVLVPEHARAELQRRVNRREALMAGGLGAISLYLAACGGSSGGGGGSSSSEPAKTVAADAKIEDRLLLANWQDYSDPENYKAFTKDMGPKITVDGYGSNEELLTKLNAGGSTFDVVAPTGYAVKTMIDKGQALKLNRELLPNIGNIEEKFTKTEYDPGNVYSVPKDYGVTSFYWRNEVVEDEPTTLAEAFEVMKGLPKGTRVNVLEGGTQLAAIALAALGYSINSEDQAELDEAKELLISVRPKISTINSTYIPRGEKGQIDFGIGWNGDVARVIAARKKKGDEMTFLIPEGKTEYWVDNWVIPADAKSPVAAHAWINKMLDPESAAKETEYHAYPVPVKGVAEIADKAIVDDPVIYVDPTKIAGYETQLQTPKGQQQRDRLYTEFKAAT